MSKTGFLTMRLMSPVVGKPVFNQAVQPQKHYANMPMEYTAIFFSFKNDNFQLKIPDLFLILAQNSVRRFYRVPTIYVLEPK